MPEGDTIHFAASALRAVLAGQVPAAIATPQRRHAMDRWPAVQAVDAHGKHLFVRFEGDLVIHSHLGMTGSWIVRRAGAPRGGRVWLVLRRGGQECLELGGPTLELLTAQRVRTDPRIAQLGPDILGDEFDAKAALVRLRAGGPERSVAEALLDQRAVAGVGNIWKCETCFSAAIDPWRPIGAVSDGELRALLEFARREMAVSAREGFIARPRCGARIRSRGQGDADRRTYWCPGCQQ